MTTRISLWTFASAVALLGMAAPAYTTEDLEGGGQALVVTGTAFAADEAAALNANTVAELWKTGSTTLVATGIGSFTGTIRVKEGVYKLTETSGWGASAATVFVTQGGTLYVPSTAADKDKEVHIAGTGCGTYPSLVKGSNAMKLVLDGDASIAMLGNWSTVATTLDMNGHALTEVYCGEAPNKKSESVWPAAKNIANPGHVVLDGANVKMTFLYNSSQLQGTNHTITIRNGANLDWYMSTKALSKNNFYTFADSSICAVL